MLTALCRVLLPPFILALALGVYRVTLPTAVSTQLEPPRATPVAILPRYDWPAAVSDEQLARVLDRVKPPVVMPLTNNFVHALRLWGPQADFGTNKIPSGAAMLRYLLDDRE